MSKIRKQIDLTNLPRYTEGLHKGKIDWGSIPSGTKINFIYGDTYGQLEIIKYSKRSQDLKIVYKDLEYPIKTGNLMQCKLGNVLCAYKNLLKFHKGDIISNENFNITILSEPTKMPTRGYRYKNKYKYQCNKCGNIDYVDPSVLSQGKTVCNVCSSRKVLQGVNDIPTTAPWMIPYFQGGYNEAKQYTAQSTKKIYPVCPHCKRIKSTKLRIGQIYRRKSIGCGCSDGISYPNKFTFNFLEQLGVEFIPEYSPKWISPKRYDFYLPDYKLIIEMDGAIGHGNETYFMSAEDGLLRDSYKDKLAKDHGINVVRIECQNSDQNSMTGCLKKYLFNYFDTSYVDWNKCEEFALTNIQKKICQFYNQHSKATITEISKIFHLHETTIRNYLKRGANIGWCNYNVDETHRRVKEHMRRIMGNPIFVYNSNGELIKEYISTSEAVRNSEKDLGIKLTRCGISSVLNNQKNSYKSFIFSYVN